MTVLTTNTDVTQCTCTYISVKLCDRVFTTADMYLHM